MSITISFEPAMQAELEAEASARAISCEQVVCEAVGDYLQRVKNPNTEYDAWFRVRVEEGLEAARQGKFTSSEEVERRAKSRREHLLQRIANQQ